MTQEHTHSGDRECPIALDQVVAIRRRDGSESTAPAGYFWSRFDHQNSWKHNGGNCDIVAYRVLG